MVNDGRVTWKEAVCEGIEKAPEALIGLLRGDRIGKVLVRFG